MESLRQKPNLSQACSTIFSPQKSALMHTKIFSLSVLKTCCPCLAALLCWLKKPGKTTMSSPGPNRAKFHSKPFIFEPTTVYKDAKQVSKFCHQISRLHHLLGRPGVLPQGRKPPFIWASSASLDPPKPNCWYRFGLSVSLCLHRSVCICV